MTKDVRGAAFYDSLDDPQNQYVYGVVEYHISQPITAVITAHEIGHIFKLGKKYSEKMNARFLDKDGKLKPFIMGCYGIGVSRILAAVIEQNHDDKGIIWPTSIAPFLVNLIATTTRDKDITAAADRIHEILLDLGEEVLYDNRDISAGIKFKDSDLIGIPLRFIVGKNFLKSKKIDVETRKDQKKLSLSLEEIPQFIEDFKKENP